MMRHALKSLLILLTAGTLLTGCASVVVDTGNLAGGYTQFDDINEPRVKLRLNEELFNEEYVPVRTEKVSQEELPPHWATLPATTLKDDETTRGILFVVAPVEWKSKVGYPEDTKKQDDIVFTIRERFYRYLLRSYPHPVRVRYAYRRTDPLTSECRVITVVAKVTDIKKGVGLPRYLIGYGAGQARIQIEGEIFEGPDRERKLGEFVLRTGHGGYAQNGLNPAVLKSDYVLRYAADEVIMHLTEKLPELLPGVEVVKRSDMEKVESIAAGN